MIGKSVFMKSVEDDDTHEITKSPNAQEIHTSIPAYLCAMLTY